MDGGEESQSDVNTVTIPNRLAELMLVVGIDDNTGLVPLNKKDFDVCKFCFRLLFFSLK